MTDAAGKQTQAGQASLGIAHLVKQYANADRPVLNDISFDVPHGKVFVIVGPSGSGKSTLLRTIAGLEPIQGGTISLNGEVIETGKPGTESAGRSKRSSELRTRVGMVFQSYDLFPNKTVLGNITLAPTLVQKRDKGEVEQEAIRLLERVGLADRKDSWPHELSGGQRQRVAICRALILHPEVLLFDEVTAALDPEMVREVLDVTDDDVLCVVQRTPEILPESDLPFLWQSNASDHDARSFDVVSIRYDGTWEPLTYAPGQWSMSRAGNGCVVTGRGMDDATVQMQHCMNIATTDENGTDVASMVVAPIENHAETPGFTPNVHFTRLGERELYTAIVLPSSDSEYAHEAILPVLMKPYGGPGFQQVIESQSFYWDAQWWADQGYIVVTTDGRGTTGRGPQWDRAIYETMKSVTLEDQIDAVRALPEALEALAGENAAANVPQPDLSRVAMIGWSYGGFLSALAVLEAPETFAAACAGAPPTDWTLYDTHYTERYLGLDSAVYERNSIIADAPQLDRPLMLIHGFADDNVTIAHSLRLSQALMATGRKHTFLPLTGITHMTNDETVAENLLILQRDFLAEALG